MNVFGTFTSKLITEEKKEDGIRQLGILRESRRDSIIR